MIFAFHDFELDAERCELRRSGKLVRADRLVLRLLAALVRDAGQLVTKDQLIDSVWDGRAVADNVLTVSMARLRKTLDHKRGEHELIATEYGRGYRFTSDVTTREEQRVRAARDGSVAPPQAVTLRSSPFVGREPVLERLRHALHEAREGRGRLCALIGEAGIGKTRAAEMLELDARALGLRVAWGYCREGGNTVSLAPWLGALGVTAAMGARAMLRALMEAQEHEPYVVLLEDVHRADAASLELLSELVEEIAHTRILVVATLRQERERGWLRQDTHLRYAVGHRNCERIELPRLQREDVAAYVRSLESNTGAADELASAVFEKSEGNPFYMVELLRPLESGVQVSVDALAVPDTALDLMRQQIARLHPETRDVLSAAAVIGHNFELPVLAGALAREPSALMASLDDAIACDAIVVAKGSPHAFAFGHELLRAVLYDALAPAARRRQHLHTAQALEAKLHAGESIAPSELAYHFRAALPDGDPRKTIEHCRAAANAAATVFAGLDVVRYLRHAIEALDLMPAASARLRMSLLFGIALYGRSQASSEHTRALQETVRLAGELGDGRSLVHAARMLMHLPGFPAMPGAAAAIERALPLLEASDTETRAIALATLACCAPHAYDAEHSGALIAEAVGLARASMTTHTANVLHPVLRCELYLHGGPAHRERAEAIARELERLALQEPQTLPVLPVELALHRANQALQRGDFAIACDLLERAVAVCRKLIGGDLLWHTERAQALCRLAQHAQHPQARAALEALHRNAERKQRLSGRALCAADRVLVFGERGDPQEGAPEASARTQALREALAPQVSDPPSIWSLKTHALAAAGLRDEAQAALQRVSATDLAKLPCDSEQLATLGHLAHAAALLHVADYRIALRTLLTPYRELVAANASSACSGSVAQVLEMLEAT